MRGGKYERAKELLARYEKENTGRLPIDTLQYNHNFFVIDKQPTGPGAVVKFAFDAMAKADLKGMARVEGRELVYLKELERGQSVYSELAGFGNTARDYDFRIEHRKAGAGVRFTGDQPLVRLIYWSIRTILCPEP